MDKYILHSTTLLTVCAFCGLKIHGIEYSCEPLLHGQHRCCEDCYRKHIADLAEKEKEA